MRAPGLAMSSTTAEWSEFVVYVGPCSPRCNGRESSSAMMSVRSNWPMFSGVDAEVRLQRMPTLTPGGMYTNEPPDHTAELSAANLLSSGGMMVPK